MAAVHEHGRVWVAATLLAIAWSSPIGARTAQAPAPVAPPAVAVAPLPSDAEIERFLLEGKTGSTEGHQEGGHRYAAGLDVH